jgi:hypothetical protein
MHSPFPTDHAEMTDNKALPGCQYHIVPLLSRSGGNVYEEKELSFHTEFPCPLFFIDLAGL